MENKSEIILYQTEDGKTKIETRLDNDTVWLTQKQMAELFQTTVANINIHLKNIFDEGELDADSVIKDFLITAADKKNYRTKFYNLDMIISVGYRIKSSVATRFRQWATQRLREYIVKGFTLDDQRLKESGYSNPYFEELLERIRDIRTSEKNFYYKVREIYSTSADYNPQSDLTQEFFATIQNKFHWAIHHHTAAELIAQRVDATKPNMGLYSFKGNKVRKTDILIAKNYLTLDELKRLNLLVEQYLIFAESQAMEHKVMYMKDWIKKLHDILVVNEKEILLDSGKVSHTKAEKIADKEYEKFKGFQDKLSIENLKQLEDGIKKIKPTKPKPGTKK